MRSTPAQAEPFFGIVIQSLWNEERADSTTMLLEAAIRIRDAAPNMTPREGMKCDMLLAYAVHQTMPKSDLGTESWYRLSSPFSLRFRATDGATDAASAIALSDGIICDARRATAAAEDQTASSTIRTLVERLAERHPRLGLSFGYIGNCDLFGSRWDDRSWKVFAKLATWKCVGACDVSFGGHSTSDLGRLMIHAERNLAAWCDEQEARLDAQEIRIVGAR